MAVVDEIRAALEAAFAPSQLQVLDTSEGHRGHAGWREGGETHFRVEISADVLAPLSRLARHRAIHTALGKELIGRIHALELIVTTP